MPRAGSRPRRLLRSRASREARKIALLVGLALDPSPNRVPALRGGQFERDDPVGRAQKPRFHLMKPTEREAFDVMRISM